MFRELFSADRVVVTDRVDDDRESRIGLKADREASLELTCQQFGRQQYPQTGHVLNACHPSGYAGPEAFTQMGPLVLTRSGPTGHKRIFHTRPEEGVGVCAPLVS